MSEESDLLATISSLLSESSETEEKTETVQDSSDSPLDLEMIMKLGSMMSDFSQEDERMRLLKDLKPFLSDTRQDKIDNAIKILRLLKIAEKAKNENLF